MDINDLERWMNEYCISDIFYDLKAYIETQQKEIEILRESLKDIANDRSVTGTHYADSYERLKHNAKRDLNESLYRLK